MPSRVFETRAIALARRVRALTRATPFTALCLSRAARVIGVRLVERDVNHAPPVVAHMRSGAVILCSTARPAERWRIAIALAAIVAIKVPKAQTAFADELLIPEQDALAWFSVFAAAGDARNAAVMLSRATRAPLRCALRARPRPATHRS